MAILEQTSAVTGAGGGRQSWIRANWGLLLAVAVLGVILLLPTPADLPVADVAASFQEAVVDVLTAKAVRAGRERGMDTLLLGGGVAANSRLRALAEERAGKAGIRVRVPRPKLCTDNGAMVAALGSHLVAAGVAPSRSIR